MVLGETHVEHVWGYACALRFSQVEWRNEEGK